MCWHHPFTAPAFLGAHRQTGRQKNKRCSWKRCSASMPPLLLPQPSVSLWVSAWWTSPRLPWVPLTGTTQINTQWKLDPEQLVHGRCRFVGGTRRLKYARMLYSIGSDIVWAPWPCPRRQQRCAVDCWMWNPEYSRRAPLKSSALQPKLRVPLNMALRIHYNKGFSLSAAFIDTPPWKVSLGF